MKVRDEFRAVYFGMLKMLIVMVGALFAMQYIPAMRTILGCAVILWVLVYIIALAMGDNVNNRDNKKRKEE